MAWSSGFWVGWGSTGSKLRPHGGRMQERLARTREFSWARSTSGPTLCKLSEP